MKIVLNRFWIFLCIIGVISLLGFDKQPDKCQVITSFREIHDGDRTRLNFHEVPLVPDSVVMVHSKCKPVLDYLSPFVYCESVLNRQLNLIHEHPSSMLRDYFCTDSLSIYNFKFSIQKLLQTDCIVPYVFKVYRFDYDSVKYVLIFLTDEQGVGVNNWAWNLLFNVNDTNDVKYVDLIVDSDLEMSRGNFNRTYPDYFGDFNQDGVLDVLMMTNKKLELYSIVNNSLRKVNGKFMDFERTWADTMDCIRYNRVNWFYDFKVKKKKKGETSFEIMQPDFENGRYVFR